MVKYVGMWTVNEMPEHIIIAAFLLPFLMLTFFTLMYFFPDFFSSDMLKTPMVFFLKINVFQLLHLVTPELWDKAIHAARKSLFICGIICTLLNLCIVILFPQKVMTFLLLSDAATFFGTIYLAMKIYESYD